MRGVYVPLGVGIRPLPAIIRYLAGTPLPPGWQLGPGNAIIRPPGVTELPPGWYVDQYGQLRHVDPLAGPLGGGQLLPPLINSEQQQDTCHIATQLASHAEYTSLAEQLKNIESRMQEIRSDLKDRAKTTAADHAADFDRAFGSAKPVTSSIGAPLSGGMPIDAYLRK
jgi:hypothetical protein